MRQNAAKSTNILGIGERFSSILAHMAKMPLNPLIFLVLVKDLAAFWRVREQYTGMCDPGIMLSFFLLDTGLALHMHSCEISVVVEMELPHQVDVNIS